MDGQDHKKPIASAGHEVHGVHLCHRCGWPFPNPHPSAKHRRGHKRVCGTIEGYKISPSDLAISDEDEQHTPSPKIEKSNAKEPGSGDGVHERSNKSEADVFSDAATEFSDSGISPSLEERLEIIKGDHKKIEQKSVEGNNNVNLLKKVDESAGSDQMYTGAEAVPVELGSHLRSDDTKYDSQKSVHTQLEGDNSASVILNSKQENASDPALMAVERKDEAHDKLDGSTRLSDATNFTPVEDEPELEDLGVPLAGKSDTVIPTETSGDDVDSSKEKCSVATVSIPVLHNSSTPEDDSTTRVLEENAKPHDGKSNFERSVAGSESGKRAPPMEEQAILDSSKPSVNSADLLPSGEVDVDPRQLESLSKTDSSLLEFKDVEFMRSRQGFEADNETGLNIGLNLDTPDADGVKSVGVADAVDASNRDGEVEFSEKPQEQPISKDSTDNPYSESLVLIENSATNNSITKDVPKTSESIHVQVDTEQKHDGSAVVLPETSDSSLSKGQETSSVEEKCLHETESDKSHATENFSMAESVAIVETPDKNSISTLLIEPASSPLHPQISNENSSNDDKKISGGENVTVDSRFLQDGDTNDKMINEKDSVSATDSLEGKWGSISGVETNSQSSPKSETNKQNSKPMNFKDHQSKSDDFEPPSFMTLVQTGKVLDSVAAPTDSEIEPVHNNQQQKSESLQAGWFPSLTNVVNDSQGRKKNEEIIAKVTNWNSGKEHHGQLINLLNEAKPPNMKQQKDERKDNCTVGTTLSSVLEPEEPKPETPHKEDWNSPARYPTVIKKEKKKGKPYWVPFVCCSSVNRDL